MNRSWLLIAIAFAVTLPAVVERLNGTHVLMAPGAAALTFGVAIVGGACLLTWAGEVAEMDVSQGLALAFLALVAVLPEYAVDLYFAAKAASHPDYTAYATANMTGANRLLIGFGWSIIVVLFWMRSRGRQRELELPASRAVELVFLTLATVYSFLIPFKGSISLVDSVVLVALFVAYIWRIGGAAAGEPDLVGPARALGALPVTTRRLAVGVLFAVSAAVILASAEPFAEALVDFGKGHGIDEFLLVQWVAPLASEAPEIVIACLLTLKGDAQAGFGAVVSSKVNQWTLLVGTLPVVYSVALGQPGALHLDNRQIEEILLTSSQSLFGVAVLSNLRLSLLEAAVLFLLFAGQLLVPARDVRYAFAFAYITLAAATLVRNRHTLTHFLRAGLSGSQQSR